MARRNRRHPKKANAARKPASKMKQFLGNIGMTQMFVVAGLMLGQLLDHNPVHGLEAMAAIFAICIAVESRKSRGTPVAL